jgi:hypothetical protein
MNQIFKTISIYYLKIIIIEILIIYFNINYKNCLIYIINKFIDIIFLYYILKKYINNLNYNNQIQISIKPYNLFSINNLYYLFGLLLLIIFITFLFKK